MGREIGSLTNDTLPPPESQYLPRDISVDNSALKTSLTTTTTPNDFCIKMGSDAESHGLIVQELCESRGGRPGLSILTSLLVSVYVKNY